MSDVTATKSPDASHRVRAASARARKALGDPRATVNLRWLRSVSGASVEEILAVVAELDSLVPVDEEIRRRHVAGGRPSYAQFRAPFELYCLVRLRKPEHVIETGVSSGVSSAHLLLALDKNKSGRLHSIDLPTRQKGAVLQPGESPVSLPPGLSTGWAVPFRSPRWDLRQGSSQELLPPLVAALTSIDLFLHDDLHTPEHLAWELDTIRPKLSPGATVLADNTQWTGDAFNAFAKEVGARVASRGASDLVGLRMPLRPRRRRPASATPTA